MRFLSSGRRLISLGLITLGITYLLWSLVGGPQPLSLDIISKVPKKEEEGGVIRPPEVPESPAQAVQSPPAPPKEADDTADAATLLQWSTASSLQGLNSTTTIEIPYQCAGPAYESFSSVLQTYAAQQHTASTTTAAAAWGRRRPPLPAHRHVLVLGNVYTRQVAYSLAAQGNGEHSTLVSVERLEGRMVNRFTFSNGATLTEVTGTYVWHSLDWERYLENQVRQPLASFDAILIGRLEASCNGTSSNAVHLRDLMSTMSAMDCHTQPPPDLAAWVNVFAGPILSVGLLSLDRGNAVQSEAVQALHTQQPSLRDRLVFVDGRRHAVQECAASSKKGVGTCVAATRGPRCVGPQGGLSDLVAWDVTEVLYKWLEDGPAPSPGVPVRPILGVTVQTQRPVPTDRRICRAPQIVAPNYPWDVLPTISVFYQCQGPRYFAFGQVLEAYTSRNEHSVLWGRRPTVLPPQVNLLLWGNSHTRQVGRALVCQYAEQLVTANLLDSKLGLVRPPTPDGIVAKGAEVYQFANGARLSILSNSYVPYSRNWALLMRDELEGRDLTNFDAVVLGHFNECGGNNTFSTELEALSEFLPEVDCRYTPPPSVTEIKEAFGDRPVVFVSMFDETRLEEARQVKKESALLDQVAFVDARAIVTAVAPSICLSSKRHSVTDCRNTEDPMKEGAILHACTGPYGGSADLAAWDVLESLWSALTASGV